ncbi:MAG: tRNA pseudouridine(55) synthase TruB [Otoolea sp.]|nr:tRNA pseudouridine(55) synthase TruB [Clostridium sp.]MDY5483972.1 tRNA pseudouridine(55) synthase TruB [Clostridium sp.]
MIHGVINIYKEAGFTSHDVVAKLRGILKQKKIGHTGTLDPAAVGVLPVCLGKGTRLCDMLTDKRKTYRTVMLLGTRTDTQDTTGTVLSTQDTAVLTEAAVRETAARFIGPYQQIPPMYSALKVNGTRLYDLARQGKEVERQARPVEIYELIVESVDLPRVTMTVTCSKGTYIRTLCHDIGESLGCGACMEQLTRTRVERFTIEDSLTLSEVETLMRAGRIQEAVIPVDEMFSRYPAYISGNQELDKLLSNGNTFSEDLAKDLAKPEGAAESWVRIYDSGRRFIGIYEYHEDTGRWKPKKIFLGGD